MREQGHLANWVVERDQWSCYGSRCRNSLSTFPYDIPAPIVYGALDKLQMESSC